MAYYKCGSVYVTQNSNVQVQTAEGAIVNFTTSLVLPLVALKTNIKAQGGGGTPQSAIPITGVSAVNLTRAGVNLFDLQNSNGFTSPYTGLTNTKLSTGFRVACSVATRTGLLSLGILKAGTYTISLSAKKSDNTIFYVGLVQDNTELSSNIQPSYTFTANGTSEYFLRGFFLNSYDYAEILDIQLQIGSTKTAYEPYNADTFTLSLGQTIYGGYVDWENGKLVVTSEYKVIDNYKIIRDSATRYHISKNNLGDFYSTGTSIMNKFRKVTTGEGFNVPGTFFLDTNNLQMNADQSYASKDDFLNAYGEITICYTLATPIEISLPTTMPSTIEGVQNWFADSGDIELEYKKIM